MSAILSLDPVLKKIFNEALVRESSDIHLEPFGEGLRLRFRAKGVMSDGPVFDNALKEALIAKLKLLARLDCTQTLLPQDGAFVMPVDGLLTGGTPVQVRLSVVPVLGGESVVMRLFKNAGELENLEGLGLAPDQVAEVKKAIAKTHGLFIIAGPTGSGKTTTFYATLRALNPETQKIITVEDPVEQRLMGVCQTPVRGELTFAAALRSILRQSPNVIGVGELRDAESARMALQSALTGHLVVATLHADSAARVPARLIDMGLEPAILAEVLSCVVSQRLLMVRLREKTSMLGIFEVMSVDEKIRTAIKGRLSVVEFLTILAKGKFLAMRERAEALVGEGYITREMMLAEFAE